MKTILRTVDKNILEMNRAGNSGTHRDAELDALRGNYEFIVCDCLMKLANFSNNLSNYHVTIIVITRANYSLLYVYLLLFITTARGKVSPGLLRIT